MGQELKFVDTTFAQAAMSTTPAFTEDATMQCLNGAAAGTSASQRDGRVVNNKSLYIRGSFQSIGNETQTAPNAQGNAMRIVIVRDAQPNAAQGTATNVINGINQFKNLTNQLRYKIIFDKTYRMPPAPTTQIAINDFGWPARVVPFKIFIPLKDKTIYNTNTTGVISDIVTNAYHMVAVCESTTGAPTIGYTCRYRFTG